MDNGRVTQAVRLKDYSQVKVGDYCLVMEDGKPTLGRVFAISEDKSCIFYDWTSSGKTFDRGIPNPADAFILRPSGRGLLAMIGENLPFPNLDSSK